MKTWYASVQDWAIGIDRRTGSLTALGVLLLVIVLAFIAVVFALFSGQFTKYDTITVRLPITSTAALPGSSVQYRDVSIGKVQGAARQGPDGTSVVEVRVYPGNLRTIPASVRAAVAPISVFGNQYVVFEAPDDPGADKLRPGDVVQARTEAPTSSVQQTVTSIDRLLVVLRPAELNVALTAVAQALQNQGRDLGETANVASAYLGALQPLWPRIVQNLGLLAPVAQQLADSSPDLIGLLGNSLTSANTVTANSEALRRLFANSADFAAVAEQLSVDIEQPFDLVSAASGPFLSAVASQPDNISRLLEGLDGFAKSVTAAGRAGPFLSTTTTVSVRNAANLATAALGGAPDEVLRQLAAGLGAGKVNPATYPPPPPPPSSPAAPTGSVVPPAAGVRTMAPPADPLPGAVVPPLPADQERTAVQQITSAMSGVQPGSADVAALLLSPLLSSLGQPA